MATFIRQNPEMIDSVDYSTPMQGVDYSYPNGDESMTVAAMQAATQLVTDLRSCTNHIGTTPADLREDTEMGLDEYVDG